MHNNKNTWNETTPTPSRTKRRIPNHIKSEQNTSQTKPINMCQASYTTEHIKTTLDTPTQNLKPNTKQIVPHKTRATSQPQQPQQLISSIKQKNCLQALNCLTHLFSCEELLDLWPKHNERTHVQTCTDSSEASVKEKCLQTGPRFFKWSPTGFDIWCFWFQHVKSFSGFVTGVRSDYRESLK